MHSTVTQAKGLSFFSPRGRGRRGAERPIGGRRVDGGSSHARIALVVLCMFGVAGVVLRSQPAGGVAGLLAGYALNDASGSAAVDASGGNATGLVLGATWVPGGRYAGGLSFDGVNDRVTMPSVALGGAFTFTAWVFETARKAYGTILTVGSDRSLYLANGVASFYANGVELSFGSPLSTGAWHHVAFVSDGALIAVYVDGVMAGGSVPRALGPTTGPLQVGAWQLGSVSYDFLSGTLDEVRLYSRALSPAEVQVVMATPLVGSTDGIAPAVTITQPSTGAVVFDTVTVVATASDNVAVTGVQFLLDGASLGSERLTPPYTVSWDTRQGSNGAHRVGARARDAAGNTALSEVTATSSNAVSQGYALSFLGRNTNDIDRVKIRLDAPARPVDVGATDFTIEFWMKALAADNPVANCTSGRDGWINGKIIVDRDIYGPPDFGDFGASLGGGRIAFGVAKGALGAGLCGTRVVADGLWHHVALTRSVSSGVIRAFVDGALDGEAVGPSGDISYRDGRSTGWANDPFLVLGAEKHDVQNTAYKGLLDEVRISTIVRYSSNFVRPVMTFLPDAQTAALYHFDEGQGTVVGDASGALGGPSTGVLRVGGIPAGPLWVTDTPFTSTGDAIPPAVALTSPAAGATVSGTTSITADASDASGIAGVQFLVNGVPLGPEDLVAPYAASWGTASVANGSHTIEAWARDVSGNGASASRSVTVSNATPTSVLAAYGINESSGTTLVDASGNGHAATISGATRVAAGRYGQALLFDGVNDRATGTAVSLPAAFTLMAWILNPSNQPWETILTIGSTRDFFLRNGVVAFELGNVEYLFGSAITTNVWHHVAIVSDGSTLRAYLDGAVRGVPIGVALGPATGSLQIGAWINGSGSSDFFGGTIDEVRVFSRALSLGEIQTHMATPIQP